MKTIVTRTLAVALSSALLLTGGATMASAQTSTTEATQASSAQARDEYGTAVFYHTAESVIWNDTGRVLPLIKAEKSSNDDWLYEPGPQLNRQTWPNSDVSPIDGIGQINSMKTESSFMRGTWHTATYGDSQGTITFTTNNPFKAASTWSCTTTGNLRCVFPKQKGWIVKAPNIGSVGLTGGDTLEVHYYICSTANAPSKYRNAGGCPVTYR